MDNMNRLELGSYILVLVGGITWGLEGLSSFVPTSLNPVDLLAEAIGVPELASGVYLLVGLSALYQVYFGYEMYQE
jgi:uncharacterized membrane protein YuzA (DUF378 family)